MINKISNIYFPQRYSNASFGKKSKKTSCSKDGTIKIRCSIKNSSVLGKGLSESRQRTYEDMLLIKKLLCERKKINLAREMLIFNEVFDDSLTAYENAVADYEEAKKCFSLTELNLKDVQHKPYQINSNKTYKNPRLSGMFAKQTDDYKFYKENQNLTLDSEIDLFQGFDKKPYDIPERFAVIADNSIRKTGNANICNEIPKIFQGLNKDEIFKALSAFSNAKKDSLILSFKINEKTITARYINGGLYGDVYKLSDSLGNTSAIKIFDTEGGTSLSVYGGISEIATLRQLTKDKVVDVPKLYLADAALYKLDENGDTYQNCPWMVSEFIDDEREVPKHGLKLEEWMKNHFMTHYDDLNINKSKKGYTLDIGGVASLNLNARDIWGIYGFGGEYNDCALGELLENSLKSGMSIREIMEIFK